MKKLETHIRKRGFDLEQIIRVGMAAIYSQSQEGKLLAYEVIEIKERGDTEFNGRTVLAHEKYPADSEWGRTGWSFLTMGNPNEVALKRAREKFDELLKRIRER